MNENNLSIKIVLPKTADIIKNSGGDTIFAIWWLSFCGNE